MLSPSTLNNTVQSRPCRHLFPRLLSSSFSMRPQRRANAGTAQGSGINGIGRDIDMYIAVIFSRSLRNSLTARLIVGHAAGEGELILYPAGARQ